MAEKVKKDRWLFLGCIIIASVFWTMQKLSSNYSFSQIYTVRYSMPDGKVFKKPPVSTIEVTLGGLRMGTKSTKNIGDKIEVELSSIIANCLLQLLQRK
jgi:hypothetical protein